MNPLTVDKISKRFLYQKDSGFLVTRSIIEKLPKNWRFTILVPKGVNRDFFPKTHIVDCIPYDYTTSIHRNRYHFNQNILAETFPYGTDVDVILNNQPEISANLQVFFTNQRREKPIIINLFHWIDCKESSEYASGLSGFITRQVDGVQSADVSLFHNDYARSLFDESTKIYNCIGYHSGFFQPQPTKFGTEPFDLPKQKIILFNHRLNNTTGWLEVFNVCKKLREKGNDFVLWFTDETNVKYKKEFEKYDWLKIKYIPFNQYGYLIRNSHFSICNITGYATWNLAVLDSILNGCLPLLPKTSLFHSMFGDDGIFFDDLESSILKHLGMTKNENDQLARNIPIPNDDFNIEKYIVSEMRRRVKDNIKKYQDVVNFIKNRTVCQKRDFVNEFWSFHANSNFQPIRLKLLNDGFIDDTNNILTEYSVPK